MSAARLTRTQHDVLQALLEQQAGLSVEQLVQATGVDQAQVSATLTGAEAAGWVAIEATERTEAMLGDGAPAPGLPELPERRILSVLAAAGGTLALPEAAAWAREHDAAMGDIVKCGAQRGWLVKQGPALALTDAGRAALEAPAVDEQALAELARAGRLFVGQEVAALLKGRDLGGKKIKLKARTERRATLTAAGQALLAGEIVVLEQKNQLTAEDLASGAWREIELRPYDVTLPAQVEHPRKVHPLVRILQETRRAFLRMGFAEITSPHVESAFWNFDALFQPQDHPARDMQDTFYCRAPAQVGLPDPALVARVRDTHQDGGATGSTGWGYRWSEDEARRAVARTHTTAATIRAVAENPAGPRKVFCVGRVFRNETISYKHLPEFTQVDGIIIDELASFRYLLGTLAEFYRQMGFAKVKFKPAFFPYTEPSAEVFVWFEPKRRWMELGGAGVFRPEVTQPLGCTAPVLAWGLGLERLAMLRFNLTDIRELYWSDLDWMREAPLCR